MGEKPKIMVSFRLDRNGIIVLERARAIFTEYYEVETVPKVENKTAAAPTDGEDAKEADEAKKDEEAKDAEKSEEKTEEEAPKEEGTEGEAAAKGETASEEVSTEPIIEVKKKIHKIPLKVTFVGADLLSYDADAVAASKKVMLDLEEDDRRVLETAESKNKLESFVFETRDTFYENEEAIEKISTEEQREEALKELTDVEDWLFDVEPEDETSALYNKKLREIRKKADAILNRMDEYKARESIVEGSAKAFEEMKSWVEKLEKELPWVPEKDRDEFETKLNKTMDWLADNLAKQAEADLTEAPVFKVKDLARKMEDTRKMGEKLLKRPKPKEKKKKKDKKKKATNATSTDAGEEAADTDKDSWKTDADGEKTDKTTEADASNTGDGESTPQGDNDPLLKKHQMEMKKKSYDFRFLILSFCFFNILIFQQ